MYLWNRYVPLQSSDFFIAFIQKKKSNYNFILSYTQCVFTSTISLYDDRKKERFTWLFGVRSHKF